MPIFYKTIEILKEKCYPLLIRDVKIKNRKNGSVMIMDTAINTVRDIYNMTESKNEKITKTGRFSGVIIPYIRLKQATKKMNYNKYIEENTGKCNNKAVIKGTRIEPITIWNFYVTNCSKDSSIDDAIKKIEREYPALNEVMIMKSIFYSIKTNSFYKLFLQ